MREHVEKPKESVTQQKPHANVAQRKTVIENYGQPCTYGPADSPKTAVVGRTMNAWLDPANPLRGQSANINTSQNGLMAWIKGIYPKAEKGMSVKGHLLNDNLGGTALGNNLYPISKGANGKHLSTAENYVKNAVWKDNNAVMYSVEALGSTNYTGADGSNAVATFRTSVRPWHDVNDPSNVGSPEYTANITSNLGAPKLREARDVAHTNLKNISGHGLLKPKKPAKTVGELSPDEQELRKRQPSALRIYATGDAVLNSTGSGALGGEQRLGNTNMLASSEFVEEHITAKQEENWREADTIARRIVSKPLEIIRANLEKKVQVKQAKQAIQAKKDEQATVDPMPEIRGSIAFELAKVGEGDIAVNAGGGQGWDLSGSFNINNGFFNESSVALEYKNTSLFGNGKIVIDEGKIPGIKSSELDVKYDNNAFSGSGHIKAAIPSISDEIVIDASYESGKGIEASTDISLPSRLPVLKNGKMKLSLSEENGIYTFSGQGKASVDIRGVSADVNVSYQNGIFVADAEVPYRYKNLSGLIKVGLNNKNNNKMEAYGWGEIDARFGEYLKGKVDAKVLPSGVLTLSGNIGLAKDPEIFSRKEINKKLLAYHLPNIPMFGVSFGGTSVGIFAKVGVGLDANAGFGPGLFKDVGAHFKYSTAKPDNFSIAGNAAVSVPVNAGLRLSGSLSAGVGLLLVSADVGVEVGGELGLQGESLSKFKFLWSPNKGLSVDMMAELSASPQFVFDVSGIATIDLPWPWEDIVKKYELAKVSVGSDMMFKVSLPVHYEEGKPFNMDTSKIVFERPDINFQSLLESVSKKAMKG